MPGSRLFWQACCQPARITGVRLEATCKGESKKPPTEAPFFRLSLLLKKIKLKNPSPFSCGTASRPGVAQASVHRCATVSPGSVGVLQAGQSTAGRPSTDTVGLAKLISRGKKNNTGSL